MLFRRLLFFDWWLNLIGFYSLIFILSCILQPLLLISPRLGVVDAADLAVIMAQGVDSDLHFDIGIFDFHVVVVVLPVGISAEILFQYDFVAETASVVGPTLSDLLVETV
jgi:hypothetical protein